MTHMGPGESFGGQYLGKKMSGGHSLKVRTIWITLLGKTLTNKVRLVTCSKIVQKS